MSLINNDINTVVPKIIFTGINPEKPPAGGGTKISALPTELMMNIFDFSQIKDVLNAKQVNKDFKNGAV